METLRPRSDLQVLSTVATRIGVWLLLLPVLRGFGQSPPSPKTSRQQPAPVVNGPLVQDLAFMSGNWHGGVPAGVFDEQWSDSRAHTMIGMFRYMENGKVRFYEFMAIEATASGPVLRLRHFDSGLAGWEDQSKPLSFSVASFTENQVIFESADKAVRLTYRRTSEESLTAVLEESGQGQTGTQEFHYTRVK